MKTIIILVLLSISTAQADYYEEVQQLEQAQQQQQIQAQQLQQQVRQNQLQQQIYDLKEEQRSERHRDTQNRLIDQIGNPNQNNQNQIRGWGQD